MKKALIDNYPPYEKIGILHNEQPIQLSTLFCKLKMNITPLLDPNNQLRLVRDPCCFKRKRY